MSSDKYVVTAAFINVRVKDVVGSDVIQGFYRGGILPADAHDADVERHLRKGMIAKVGSPAAEGVSPVGERVQFDENSNPMSPEQAKAAEAKRPSPAKMAPAKAQPTGKVS